MSILIKYIEPFLLYIRKKVMWNQILLMALLLTIMFSSCVVSDDNMCDGKNEVRQWRTASFNAKSCWFHQMLAYKFTITTEEGKKTQMYCRYNFLELKRILIFFFIRKKKCHPSIFSFLNEQQMQLKQNSLFWQKIPTRFPH